jgi:predicted dehydrogenase
LTVSPAAAPPLRVGIIGAGNVALGYHLPAYQALAGQFRVVAIADPTAERRALAVEQTGLAEADVHAEPGELLERRDLDVVDVCTPQHLRRELIVAAAQGGRHILSEKPLATTPRDAQVMVEAARSAGVRFGIVHNYLFFPEVLRTLELIDADEIGPVEVAILNWLSVEDRPGNAAYRPSWRHDPGQAGGGVLMDMLHIVYLAEALVGQPIQRVSAYVSARGEGAHVEDAAICRFETNENVALVNVGWGVGPGGFVVSGPAGRIVVEYRDGGSGPFQPFERLTIQGRTGRRVERQLLAGRSIERVLLDFAAAVRDGREPVATGEQGGHILEATLAAYASAALGRTVELPLRPGEPIFEKGVSGLAELELAPWSMVRRKGLFGIGASLVSTS